MEEGNNQSINKVVTEMNTKEYNYLLNSNLLLKYKEFSKQQLKRELKQLKRNTSEDVNTIKYLSNSCETNLLDGITINLVFTLQIIIAK